MLQIEIASWTPENREKVMDRVAETLKRTGSLPWKLNGTEPAKPGMLQIWLDVHRNRYYELLNRPTLPEAPQEFETFNRWTDIMQFELLSVIEMEEALKILGKL